jgi:hypothetical protein
MAAEIHPLHPEVRGLLGEVLGHLHQSDPDRTEMQKAISEAEAAFDAMDKRGMSELALASIYHKLGSSFMTVRLPQYRKCNHGVFIYFRQRSKSWDDMRFLFFKRAYPYFLPIFRPLLTYP